MRLIDADELIEIAHEMIDEDPDAFNGGYSYNAVTVEEINEAPTVEAVPVVHGEWEYDENGIDWNLGAWRCSKCKCKNNNIGGDSKTNPYLFVGSNLCPNCGAYMRKKV